MRERYEPFIETSLVSIYQKGDKSLIITKKEITFQTNNRILKRKMSPEREPIKEKEILPICGECNQDVRVEDFEDETEGRYPVRYKDEMFHSDCLTKKLSTKK